MELSAIELGTLREGLRKEIIARRNAVDGADLAALKYPHAKMLIARLSIAMDLYDRLNDQLGNVLSMGDMA